MDMNNLPTNATAFASFIDEMRADLEVNKKDWENPTLDRYLEALSAIFTDFQGNLLARAGGPTIPYDVLAKMLFIAGRYERPTAAPEGARRRRWTPPKR